MTYIIVRKVGYQVSVARDNRRGLGLDGGGLLGGLLAI